MSEKKSYDIVVELSIAANRNVGHGEFTDNVARQIAARAAELRERSGLRFWLIVPKSLKGAFGPDVNYIILHKFWSRKALQFYPRHFDLLHLLHQYSRVHYMCMADKQLLTVHDINFIYEKSGFSLKRRISRFKLRLKRADYLSFISNFSKEDTERHFPFNHPWRIIYNGVTDLRPIADPAQLAGLNPGRDFLLHISSAQPKKNVHLLVEMMRWLPDERLVLVGNWRSSYGRGIRSRIEELGLTNVRMLDHVSEPQKAALYASCKAFLFPSLCEGFGLPPLEAMYFGKPVFLSTLTSLPEIGGACAYYWPDLDPQRMAARLNEGLKDFEANAETLSKRLVQRAESFSWESCVEGYIEYYLDLLNIKH